MAAGLPVVSTRHAGIPDVVIENETGLLVDEGDIDTMASYMLKLVENRDLAESFGKNGNARILSEFTLQKHISTIDRLIQEIF